MATQSKPIKLFNRYISVLLIIAMLLSLVSCAVPSKDEATSKYPPGTILGEDVLVEDIIEEKYLTEEYWYEDEIFETAIVEALLEEIIITEVYSVEFIILEKDATDFFTEEEMLTIFGVGFDYNQILKKFAIGGGVILVTAIVAAAGRGTPFAAQLALPLERAVEYAIRGMATGAAEGSASAIDVRLGLAIAVADLIIDIVTTVVKMIPTAIVPVISPVTLILGIANGVMSVSRLVTAIKTYNATDISEVNWRNVDWSEVGYAALDSGASGFEFGAVVGTLAGSVEAGILINRELANTIVDEDGVRTYKNIPKDNGHWSGEPGNSDWIPDKDYVPPEKAPTNPYSNPDNLSWGDILKKYGIESIPYKNGYPVLDAFAEYTVTISDFTADRNANFSQANKALAAILGDSPDDVEAYIKKAGLVWHEVEDMATMQLVPHEVHANISHRGGVSEYKAITFLEIDNEK